MKTPLPHKQQHVLGMIEHTGRDDEIFHLLIRDDGTCFVQIHYSPNRDYSRPFWGDLIPPDDYQKYNISGTPLTTLIEQVLASERTSQK